MVAVVLAILAKLLVILKLGLRSISKRITSLTTTCFGSYSSLCFKKNDKTNSKFDLKVKEALHINRRKPHKNHFALNLSL